MTIQEFIRQNLEELDNAILNVVPNNPLDNAEREAWIMNDENLYNWALDSGVEDL